MTHFRLPKIVPSPCSNYGRRKEKIKSLLAILITVRPRNVSGQLFAKKDV